MRERRNFENKRKFIDNFPQETYFFVKNGAQLESNKDYYYIIKSNH